MLVLKCLTNGSYEEVIAQNLKTLSLTKLNVDRRLCAAKQIDRRHDRVSVKQRKSMSPLSLPYVLFVVSNEWLRDGELRRLLVFV